MYSITDAGYVWLDSSAAMLNAYRDTIDRFFGLYGAGPTSSRDKARRADEREGDTGMTKAEGASRATDPFETWRELYDKNERAWSAALEEAMGSPEFGESSGKMLETMLAAQKSVRDNMRTYLESMNVPTREDIARLGELVIGLEEKVDQVVDRLDAIDDAVRAVPAGPAGPAGPTGRVGPRGRQARSDPRERRARSDPREPTGEGCGPKGATGKTGAAGRAGAAVRAKPAGRGEARGERPMTPTAPTSWPDATSVWASNDRALDMARAILGSADAPVGLTPKELIWRKNKAALYRYTRTEPATHRTPIFLVLPLINRAYILDLRPGASFVEFLLSEGFDVFLIDWGTPGDEDRALDITTLVTRYLPRAAKAIQRASGTDEITVLGYCIGGALATCFAALHPEVVRNLVLLTAPIDFSDAGQFGRMTARGASPSS